MWINKAGGQNLLSLVTTNLDLYWPYTDLGKKPMQNISEVKNLKNLHGEKTQMKTGSSNR